MPKTLPDGRIEIEQGDTLFDIYGSDWKNISGYNSDPKKLQIGTNLPAVPQPKKSPVSMLSTDDAIKDLDQTKKKFDTQYGLEDETTDDVAGEAPVIEEEATTEKPEGGYSFEDASDIWGKDFTGIKRGADGLFYPDSSAYERAGVKGMGEDLQEELDDSDQAIEDEYNKWQTYNIETDPVFIAQQNAITAQYDILRRQMEQKNKARQRAIETIGIRGGTRMYAGSIQMGIEGEELSQASARITDIKNAELQAIANARLALESNEFNKFSRNFDILQDIRKNKTDALTAYNEKLISINKAMQAQIKEERLVAKDERERQATTTESLSNLALASLTGDSETDMATLQSLADQYGIDVNMLSSQVAKLQTDMESDLMTSDLKEYRMAVSQGYEKTFRDWQKDNKGEQLVSGGGGSKFRLNTKTGKYEMVVPPIWKEPTGGGKDVVKVKLSSTNRNLLIGAGFPSDIISGIEADLTTGNTLDDVIAGLTGATKDQITTLTNVFTGVTATQARKKSENVIFPDQIRNIAEQAISKLGDDAISSIEKAPTINGKTLTETIRQSIIAEIKAIQSEGRTFWQKILPGGK